MRVDDATPLQEGRGGTRRVQGRQAARRWTMGAASEQGGTDTHVCRWVRVRAGRHGLFVVQTHLHKGAAGDARGLGGAAQSAATASAARTCLRRLVGVLRDDDAASTPSLLPLALKKAKRPAVRRKHLAYKSSPKPHKHLVDKSSPKPTI